MRKLGLVAAGLALAVAGYVAPVRAQETKTLLEVAAGNPDFSTLVAAVQAADPSIAALLGNKDIQLTVFAPTNEAFAGLFTALGVTAEQVLTQKDLLTTVLAYHVVPGGLNAAGLTKSNGWYVGTALGDYGVTADGFPIGAFQITATKITTSSGSTATIVTPDVAASNGVIHVVDSVLVPADYAAIASGTMTTGMMEATAEATMAMAATAEATMAMAATAEATMAMEGTMEATAEGTMTAMENPFAELSIAEVVVASTKASPAQFTTLLAAVQAASPVIASELTVGGPYTVFAPTDAAFGVAIASLGTTPEKLLADQALLTNVLSYHVLPGKFSAATLVAAAAKGPIFLATQLGGTAVKVEVTGGNVVIDNATVTAADLMPSNGIVHVIDGVLLPPA